MKSATLMLAVIGLALAVLAVTSEASPAYQVFAEDPEMNDDLETSTQEETTTEEAAPTTEKTTTTTTASASTMSVAAVAMVAVVLARLL